jgi:hypothetical protein
MGFRAASLEAVRRGVECVIECGLAHAAQPLGLAVVNAVRRHVAKVRVPVRGVVPSEESLAVGPCVLDAAETCREVRPVLQRLELRLGVRVVIRCAGLAVALNNVQVRQQGGHRLGAHAGAPLGVQRERAAGSMSWRATESAISCWASSASSRSAINQPTTQATADVQDQVEVETRPLGRTLELGGKVPRPNRVGRLGQQLRSGVGGMDALIAPLTAGAVSAKRSRLRVFSRSCSSAAPSASGGQGRGARGRTGPTNAPRRAWALAWARWRAGAPRHRPTTGVAHTQRSDVCLSFK